MRVVLVMGDNTSVISGSMSGSSDQHGHTRIEQRYTPVKSLAVPIYEAIPLRRRRSFACRAISKRDNDELPGYDPLTIINTHLNILGLTKCGCPCVLRLSFVLRNNTSKAAFMTQKSCREGQYCGVDGTETRVGSQLDRT